MPIPIPILTFCPSWLSTKLTISLARFFCWIGWSHGIWGSHDLLYKLVINCASLMIKTYPTTWAQHFKLINFWQHFKLIFLSSKTLLYKTINISTLILKVWERKKFPSLLPLLTLGRVKRFPSFQVSSGYFKPSVNSWGAKGRNAWKTHTLLKLIWRCLEIHSKFFLVEDSRFESSFMV